MLLAFELLLSFWAALLLYGLLGLGWASFCLTERLHRLAFAPLLGLCLHLFVIVNANYLGFTADKTLGAQLLLTAGLGALGYLMLLKRARLKRTESRFKGLKNFAPLALLVSLVFMAGVWPVIAWLGRLGSINYSGDFFAYWSMGYWLQNHSFGHGTALHPALNCVSSSAISYMALGMRMGAQVWLAWLCAFLRLLPEDLYSALSAFLLALQAALVYLLADLALGGKRRCAAFAVGGLFAFHPLTLWAHFGSYFPQVMGLALSLGFFVLLLFPWRHPLRLGLLGGFFLGALFPSYIEIVPVLGVVCALTALLRLFQREVLWKQFFFFCAGCLLVFVPAAWLTLAYDVRGLVYQITTQYSYGMEQSTLWWVLGGLFLGFTPLQIFPGVIHRLWPLHKALIIAGFVLTCAVVASRIKKLPLKAAFWALCAAFAALLAYVRLRYGLEERPLSWNFFKALNYAVPFLFFFAPLAFFTLEKKYRGLWAVFLLPYAVSELYFWNEFRRECLFTSKPPEPLLDRRLAFVKNLPPGGFYLAAWPAEMDRYNNFRAFIERDFIEENRPCVSFQGGPCFSHLAFLGDSARRRGFFNDLRRPDKQMRYVYPNYGEPVSYAFCLPWASFPGKTLYADRLCKIIDIRREPLALPMMDGPGGNKNFYLSCPKLTAAELAAAKHRALEVTVLSSRAQRLLFTVSEQTYSGEKRLEVFTVSAAAGATPLSIPLDIFDTGVGLLMRVRAPGGRDSLRLLNLKDFSLPAAPPGELAPPACATVEIASSQETVLGWFPTVPGACYNLCYGPRAGAYANTSVFTGPDADHGGIFKIPPGHWHFAVRTVKDGRMSAFSPDVAVEIFP